MSDLQREERGSRGRLLKRSLLAVWGLIVAGAPVARAQDCTGATPPDIVIATPLRAETIQDPSKTVTVSGTVTDAESAIVAISIDGIDVPVTGTQLSESFSTDVPSAWGINVLRVAAADACGRQREVVQSYLRSGVFAPASTSIDPDAAVPNGLFAHLNQSVLLDLVELLNEELATIGWNQVIANPIATRGSDSCGALQVKARYREVRRRTISGDQPEIGTILFWDDGLIADISVDSLTVPLSVDFDYCALGVPGSATLSPTVRLTNASATGTLTPSIVGGRVQVGIEDVSTDADFSVSVGCSIPVVCDVIDTAVTAIASGIVRPLILNLVDDLLAEELPPLAEDLFNTYRIPATLPLPSPEGSPLRTVIAIDGIASTGPDLFGFPFQFGFGELVSSVQVYPIARGPGISPTAPGSALRGGSVPGFSRTDYDAGLAIADDLVNQMFWAGWYAGELDVPDAKAQAAEQGLEVVALSLSGQLPPIWRATTPNRAEVRIGDLRIDGVVDLAEIAPPLTGQLSATLFVSGRTEGAVGIDELAQTLTYSVDTTEVEIHVEALSLPFPESQVVSLLEAPLARLLESTIEDAISRIPLPTIPLAGIGGPGGFALGFSPASAVSAPDFTRITGSLGFVAICGDGDVLGGELCDDGDREAGDGCGASCRPEPGFSCTGSPSACLSLCGDGFVVAGEACDDGNLEAGDGCDAICQVEPAFDCVGEPSVCTGIGTPVAGRTLRIVNRLPDDEAKNKLVVLARDPAIAIAAPDSPDDPRCSAPGGGGGRIVVESEASGERYEQALPCENWFLLGRPSKPRGYKYVDRELDDGACKRVVVVDGALVRALCLGKGPSVLGYDLREGETQPPVVARIRTGADAAYCARFELEVRKTGSNARTLVVRDNPRPATCP